MAEYIVREQAKQAIFEYIMGQTISKYPSKKLCEASRKGAEGAMNELDYVPTADVVEVKHSRWEKISGFYVCNICGTSPAYWEPEPNNPKGYPPYCHNCGAKMDGRSDV